MGKVRLNKFEPTASAIVDNHATTIHEVEELDQDMASTSTSSSRSFLQYTITSRDHPTTAPAPGQLLLSSTNENIPKTTSSAKRHQEEESLHHLKQQQHRSSASVSKLWTERKEQRETLAVLKKLVPTIGANQDVSQLELIQHVLDYIYDLNRQLNTNEAEEEEEMEEQGEINNGGGGVDRSSVSMMTETDLEALNSWFDRLSPSLSVAATTTVASSNNNIVEA